MGQPARIEKDEDAWFYVETWDRYHGWIESRWVNRTVSRPTRVVTVAALFTDALRTPDPQSEIWTKLVITTTLELVEKQKDLSHVRLPDGTEAWVADRDVRISSTDEQELPLPATGPELVRTAQRFLGVPYLWGGSTPFGLDCSGFVQLAYKLNGVGLLRDANIQASDPRAIAVEKTDLATGDLVFFAGGEDKSKITHVGMACGDGTFIHSAGGAGVSINNLTDEPFEANYWGARRMPGV